MSSSVLPSADHRAARFDAFLDRLREDVYPEPPSGQHSEITRQMWARLQAQVKLPAGARVLDVGCGQGLALELFRAAGHRAVGITIGHEDLAACVAQGYEALEMDQSFLDFPEGSFDLVWCRHALEHSVAPYFTLAGFHRVLAPGGTLYVEVPAPETACHHEQNPNHYSVLGQPAWLSLMQRAGFELLDGIQINFTVPAGPDTYWGFILRKRAAAPRRSEPAPAGDPLREIEFHFPAAGTEQALTLRLDTREDSQATMAAELAAGRFYEPEVSYFLTNVLEAGDTFIDVGGHVGYFTLLASRAVGPSGRVYAFEPEAGNARRLQGHLALNEAGNVTLLPQALGETEGEVLLHVNADNAGGHALWDVREFPTNHQTRARPEVRRVPLTTLAGLLERTQGERIRVVKVDAEGSEHAILKGGMLLFMAREVPFIICEINEFALHQMGASGRGMRAFMAACGYQCYRLSAEEPCLIPFPPEEEHATPYVYNVLFTTQPVLP